MNKEQASDSLGGLIGEFSKGAAGIIYEDSHGRSISDIEANKRGISVDEFHDRLWAAAAIGVSAIGTYLLLKR